jgi:hypothetical protein
MLKLHKQIYFKIKLNPSHISFKIFFSQKLHKTNLGSRTAPSAAHPAPGAGGSGTRQIL